MSEQFLLLLEVLANSAMSWFVLPISSEVYWFALLSFHPGQMLWPTVAAVIGSVAGMLASYLIGWLIALDRKNMPLSAEKYERASFFTHRFIVWVFILPWIPFLPLLALACGFLHCRLGRVLPLIMIGRFCYYSYYLYS